MRQTQSTPYLVLAYRRNEKLKPTKNIKIVGRVPAPSGNSAIQKSFPNIHKSSINKSIHVSLSQLISVFNQNFFSF